MFVGGLYALEWFTVVGLGFRSAKPERQGLQHETTSYVQVAAPPARCRPGHDPMFCARGLCRPTGDPASGKRGALRFVLLCRLYDGDLVEDA